MTLPQIYRLLRAFAWLRWRVLINSLERRGSRDVMERFSAAFEQLGPAIAALLMLPSGAMLAALAGYVGWTLGTESATLTFGIIRLSLFAACALTIAGPLLLPAGERANVVRFLLLPIPRAVLYLAQVMSALADPWILLASCVVIALPLGMAAAGNVTGAGITAIAGVLLIVLLAGMTQLATHAIQLVLRDRRRAELFTLVVVVLLPVVGMLPALLDRGGRQSARIEEPATVHEPGWPSRIEAAIKAGVPSEVYARAARTAAQTGAGSAAGLVLVLAATGAAAHLIALRLFALVLAAPGHVAQSRSSGEQAMSRLRIPGVPVAVSAVAINQLRLALRTPRGRSTVISPLMVFAVFAMLMARGTASDFTAFAPGSGVGLAAFTSAISLLAILPFAMNQFAVDRAGLTMALLLPLETRALLRGKAIGNALIVAIPVTVCLAGAAILFPGNSAATWACLPLTLISAYFLVAPIAAILSAIFPRPVDLNSIGNSSNAHGLAGLLGTLAVAVAGAPGLAAAFILPKMTDRPMLAPLVLAVWSVVCLGISAFGFRMAAAIFDQRKENLGMSSQRPA